MSKCSSSGKNEVSFFISGIVFVWLVYFGFDDIKKDIYMLYEFDGVFFN